MTLDQASNGIGIVGLIGHDDRAERQNLEQDISLQRVSGIAARQVERERPTLAIAQRVELGVPATAARADRLLPRPPFPPAAERCAFT
jgi:hypothetical protein